MKKRVVILVLFVIGLVIIFVVLEKEKLDMTKGAKGNELKEEDLISGGDGTHWFSLKGKIEEIDSTEKKMSVIISKNSFFDSSKIWLDCSKGSLELEKAEKGVEITFYFFRSSIKDDTVKAEEIVYE